MWIWLLTISIVASAVIGISLYVYRHTHFTARFISLKNTTTTTVLAQLATLEERTKYLQGLEAKIEGVRSSQDSDSRELRERLYGEYSKRLQGAIGLLQETYGRMSEMTTNAFRELTDKKR